MFQFPIGDKLSLFAMPPMLPLQHVLWHMVAFRRRCYPDTCQVGELWMYLGDGGVHAVRDTCCRCLAYLRRPFSHLVFYRWTISINYSHLGHSQEEFGGFYVCCDNVELNNESIQTLSV